MKTLRILLLGLAALLPALPGEAKADEPLPPPTIRRSRPPAWSRPVAPRPAPRPAPPVAQPVPPVAQPAPPVVQPVPPVAQPAPPVAQPPVLPPAREPWRETRDAASVYDPGWASSITSARLRPPAPQPRAPRARVPGDDNRVPPPAEVLRPRVRADDLPAVDVPLVPPAPAPGTTPLPHPPWSDPVHVPRADVPPVAPLRAQPIAPPPAAPAAAPAPATVPWSDAVDVEARAREREQLYVPPRTLPPPAEPNWASGITAPKPAGWHLRQDQPARAPLPRREIRDSGSPDLPPPAWAGSEVYRPPVRAPARAPEPTTLPRVPAPRAAPAPVAPPGGWSAPVDTGRGVGAQPPLQPRAPPPVQPRVLPPVQPRVAPRRLPPLEAGSGALPPPPKPPVRTGR